MVIDNAASSTTQWGIGSTSVVLEALTESGQPTSLCLAYPSVSAMPTVGPVTLGQDLYWRLLSGQEVLPIQQGAGRFARNYLDYYNLRAVDALEVGRNAFSCDDVWSGAPLAYQRRGGCFRAGQPEPFRRIGRPRQQRFLLGQHCRGQLCHFRSARPAAAAKGPRLPEPGSRDAEQVQIQLLSLFFIDEVANYRESEDGEKSKIASPSPALGLEKKKNCQKKKYIKS